MATKIESYYFNDKSYTPVVTINNSNTNNQNAATIEKSLYNTDRIIPISTQGDFSNFTIDGVINTQVPSDVFRTAKAAYWADWRTSYERGAWLCATATVVHGIGAHTSSKYPELFLAAALVGLVMTFVFIKWAHDAAVQQQGWKVEPAQTVAEDRKIAYEAGFAHVYDQKMKIGPDAKLPRLAPFEVSYLFEKYLGARSQELLDEAPLTSQAKNDWLKKFTTKNPISRAGLKYAFESVPTKFEPVAQEYEALAEKLNAIRETAQKKRLGIERKTTKQIQNAEKSKKMADGFDHLDPNVLVKDKKSRSPTPTTNIIAAVQINQATEERDSTIATIDEEENATLAAHYYAAKKILEKAKTI